MTREKTGTRRRYSKDVKAQVVAECGAPGALVAKVAMTHGINTNIVHGWRKQARQDAGTVVSKPADFIAVTVNRFRCRRLRLTPVSATSRLNCAVARSL